MAVEPRPPVLEAETELDAHTVCSNVVAAECVPLEVDYMQTILHHLTRRDLMRGGYAMVIRALILTAVASILVDVVTIETLGFAPGWYGTIAKSLILLAAAVYYARRGNVHLARYAVVLTALVLFPHLAVLVGRTPLWQSMFMQQTFTGYYASSVLLKLVSTIPLIALLLLLFKSPEEVYLGKGDLSVKAEPIKWLGIHPNWVTWRKLSILSALAISGGTLLLTLITVTGFSVPETFGALPRHMPAIVLFALINSLSEGFMFRNAILGSLRRALPKEQVLLIAAAFFGMAHFYGAPSGIVGIVMSGLLGWYMSRSMYETGGLVSSWIIHFMQDVVIFATLFLLGGFI